MNPMPAPLTDAELDALGALAGLRINRCIDEILSSLPASPGTSAPSPPSGVSGGAGTFSSEDRT
ncbi:hypothetical protein DyAD56_16035 [Dyella sp. AD56]|uniref:hypothetical protein n=1 Tax=Dyella sp. AD56 TaxID=1528744 RepID=UPI000C84D9F7|nr:hypothetical protein [Dyella sp. AD56]PMQ04198.1 hypothetical protein DyAD56_16035 [Dyella sp. AD56]